MIREVLRGEIGAARDIVILNAAAALWAAGKGDTPLRCARLAADAIDLGVANELLSRLVHLSNH